MPSHKVLSGVGARRSLRKPFAMKSSILSILLLLFLSSPAAATLRDIRVDGKAPAEFVATQTGNAWAVVIGIDAYQYVPRLAYAVADAQEVGEMLKQQGFQVTELYDGQATRQVILHELGDKLIEKVGEHDRVAIFFAGHGETRQFGSGSPMGYLLSVEAKPRMLSGTAIDMSAIRALARALPARQVLFLVDVCYGGIAGQRFRSLQPEMTEAYLRQITKERGRQLITAGGADQRALEAPEWGHSLFTYYLLQGVRNGLADLNGDGIVPTTELYTYLESRVFKEARLRGHEQRPELWALGAEQGEFVFIPGSKPSVGEESAGGSANELAMVLQELKALKEQLRRRPPQDLDPGGESQAEELARLRAAVKALQERIPEPLEEKKSHSKENREAPFPASTTQAAEETIEVRNSSVYLGKNRYEGKGVWEWTIYVRGDKSTLDEIQCVTYTLHPTFPDPIRKVCHMGEIDRAFSHTTRGWGTFTVDVLISFKDGSELGKKHQLVFASEK